MKKISLLLVIISFCFSQTITPDAALQNLTDGNIRYVNQKFKSKDFRSDREKQAKGQKPYAAILTCSDSRVPPEIIFDASLGELFVIRDAGNVVDPIVLGSIEYAVEHLNVPLILILGHTSCGAVTATVKGGEVPENIAAIVNSIEPAVKIVKPISKNESELIKNSIEENVHLQVKEAILKSKIIKEYLEQNKVKIYGGLYDIETGKVEFFEYKTEH